MSKKKVLIFDDNIELLELCTLILEGLELDIKTSITSDNADQQVLDYMPDLILMDNWLPNISGIEATRLIKAQKQTSQIPVIYFTANNNIDKLAKEAGADGFISKPFDITELEQMVKDHLGLV